jgi:hypothetical protein
LLRSSNNSINSLTQNNITHLSQISTSAPVSGHQNGNGNNPPPLSNQSNVTVSVPNTSVSNIINPTAGSNKAYYARN